MRERRTTLRQIAQRVRVSTATVSQALNGKGRISEDKRRQIVLLLREVGYKPKTLRRPVFFLYSREEIALSHAHVPFVETYTGLNETFGQALLDLHVDFVNPLSPLQPQLDSLLSHKPGAVVLDSSLKDTLQPAYEFFEENSIPVVQVGHVQRSRTCDAVVVDNFSGARNAVRHLSTQHRHIACLRWHVGGDPASGEKFSGYQCGMADAGLTVRPQDVIESPFKREAPAQLPGRVAIEQLLAQKDHATAVFVENSFISPPMIYPAFPHEERLPERIAALDFVHFEALHMDLIQGVMAGALGFPSRHTKIMRIGWHELGQVAAKRILERLEGAGNAGQVLRLVPRLHQADEMGVRLLV